MTPSPPAIIRKRSTSLDPIPTNTEPSIPTMEGLRAVAFDIYGTLVISGSGDIGVSDAQHQEEALQTILREFDFAPPPANAPLSHRFQELIVAEHERARSEGVDFPEVEIREIWQSLLGHPIDDRLEAVAVAYECATNPVWPMPAAAEVLEELRTRGILLGIVSNAQFYTPHLFEALFQADLEALGFREDLCFFSYRLREAKPGQTLYQKLRDALASHALSPDEVLYVGNDALKDIHPAASLGFKTALFAGDQRSLRLREDEPDLHPPDAVLTHLSQVLEILP